MSFEEKVIRVYQCSSDMKETTLSIEIPLTTIKDCYNLRLDGSPLMITRQGGENSFQIIWPEEIEFDIGVGENFLYRKDDRLYFSEWHEDPEYREEVNIREYPSGKLINKLDGAFFSFRDGLNWILR